MSSNNNIKKPLPVKPSKEGCGPFVCAFSFSVALAVVIYVGGGLISNGVKLANKHQRELLQNAFYQGADFGSDKGISCGRSKLYLSYKKEIDTVRDNFSKDHKLSRLNVKDGYEVWYEMRKGTYDYQPSLGRESDCEITREMANDYYNSRIAN